MLHGNQSVNASHCFRWSFCAV